MNCGRIKCNVKIDGTNISETLPITYVETFNGINAIPYCIIKIQDNPINKSLLMDDKVFKIGAKVEVEFGYDNDAKNVFSGILINQSFNLDATIGLCLFEITAKGKTFQMTIANKVTSYKDKTDSDILKEITSRYGLNASIGNMTTKHEILTQYGVTDWDFVNMRAEAYGFVVSLKDDKITIDKPGTSTCGKATFCENIISMNLDIVGDSQLDSTEGKIWDIASQKVKEIKSDNINEKSFGSVKCNDIISANGKNKSLFVHSGNKNETELKTLLSGIMTLNRYSKIQGFMTVIGNNNLNPNSCVTIEKCSEKYNGNAYISYVQHIFDKGEWTTRLHIGLTEKRYVNTHTDVFTHGVNGALPEIKGLSIGTVIKIDGDPDNNFRVQVCIPLIHNAGEGTWCRLSTFYASKNGGAIFFPEINDEVIVGFIENDSRYPVILGSVYNPKNKPSIDKIEAANTTKKICTNSKLEILFNEKDKIITINTPGKRTITMSDKDESLELTNGSDKISITKGSITIKCGKDVTIEGNNIKLKANSAIQLKSTSDMKIEGGNVSLKGSMGMKIEGSASASVKSSGITEIKGSLVKIN